MSFRVQNPIDGFPLLKNPISIVLLLCVLGALFFIPGLDRVHLFDWDEANFAEASREMIERGNYLQVTIDYKPFFQKPPFFMWLQVLSMTTFGVGEFAARFPNALCGIVTMVVVFLIGSRIYAPLFGLFWALAFLGSFLPHFFYKSAIIDPVFNLFIFVGLIGIAKGILVPQGFRRRGWYALAGLIVGIAILAKGPVALLVVCLTIGIYWASIRFRRFFGLLDIVAFLGATGIAAALFFGIETLSHGTTFIREFIAYQIKLFSTGDSGHGRPFYFHFVVTLFGCFPASFFAILAFVKRDEPTTVQQLVNRLVIILFWVVLILFSIVKTKTVLYASLTWFPVTYLAALYLYNVADGTRAFKRPLLISLAVFGGVVSLVITLFPLLLMQKELLIPLIRDKFAVLCLQNPVHWTGFEVLLGIGYGVCIALSLVWFVRNHPVAGTLTLFGSTALCMLLFMFIFAGKIEVYSQGGPIAFYKEHSSDNTYTRALFKSYADLFYTQKKPGTDPRSHDKNWLLRGDIDKPVFLVARSTQKAPYEDSTLRLVRLKEEYGFVYYRRDIPEIDSSIKIVR